MAAFETILFDLDGTLTDSGDGIIRCVQSALEFVGRDVPDATALRWCVGPPLKDNFRKLGADPEEVDLLVAAYRRRYLDVGMFENRVYPEVSELLAQLRGFGCELHVVTSKPREMAVTILDHFDLSKFFTRIFGSELDGRLTDKGELIAHAQQHAAFSARTAAFVGDREFDVRGARAHGIFAIGALWGYGTSGELEAAGAQALARSPSELLQLLTG